MQLSYFEGNNFGDAINPIVFNSHFPGFFNDDDSEIFLGIGSILGFIKPSSTVKKAIVFSSGFAYDDIPEIDTRYDIRCVRGPMTAKALKIDNSFAVTDGALLLRTLPDFESKPAKKQKYCFIPHHISESMFDRWHELFKDTGIKFVSPAQDPLAVIQIIRESEIVLAEAMHAAIIADTFRVPWIPVKMFRHVNNFKWQDWFLSMNLGEYNPIFLPRLYNKEWIEWIIYDKLKFKQKHPVNSSFSWLYSGFQGAMKENGYRRRLKVFQNIEPTLSSDKIMNQRLDRLLAIAEDIRTDYKVKV